MTRALLLAFTLLAGLFAKQGGARVAGRIDLSTFIPEGLAVDADTGAIYVGSIRHGGIARLDGRNGWRWFVPPRAHGSWGFLGLKADPARRRLWAVSNARPNLLGFREADRGRSAVFVFDLRSGALVRRVDLPDRGVHLLNDLALTPDGGAWVSDSEAGALWRVPPRGRPTRLPLARRLEYPNGLVLTRDGRGLLVVEDAGSGLCRVDFDGSVRPVPAWPGASFTGLDGLTRHGAGLLAVQNGRDPGRILSLRLDGDERTVSAVKVLLEGHPLLAEVPTTGDLLGTEFVFIANSLIHRLGDDGRLRPGPDSPPVILAVEVGPVP
ncbi:MAG: SMP-30/gluconolactonase/LRE family protein [Holophagaceae bacterium]